MLVSETEYLILQVKPYLKSELLFAGNSVFLGGVYPGKCLIWREKLFLSLSFLLEIGAFNLYYLSK